MLNCRIVLNLIWKNQQISRASLSRITGLSRSTVSAIIAELMDKGLVKELGIGPSSGGRRPMLLCMEDEATTLIGVEWQAGQLKLAEVNLSGAIRKFRQHDVSTLPEAQAWAELQAILRQTISDCEQRSQPVLGIGLALVRKRGEEALWQKRVLDLALPSKIPVLLEQLALAGALAESWWSGPIQATRSLMYCEFSARLSFGLLMLDEKMNLRPCLGGDFDETIGRGGEPLRTLQEHWQPSHLEADPSTLVAELSVALKNSLSLLRPDRVVFGGEAKALISACRQQLTQPEGDGAYQALYGIELARFGDQQLCLGAAAAVMSKILDDYRLLDAAPVPPSPREPYLYANSARDWLGARE